MCGSRARRITRTLIRGTSGDDPRIPAFVPHASLRVIGSHIELLTRIGLKRRGRRDRREFIRTLHELAFCSSSSFSGRSEDEGNCWSQFSPCVKSGSKPQSAPTFNNMRMKRACDSPYYVTGVFTLRALGVLCVSRFYSVQIPGLNSDILLLAQHRYRGVRDLPSSRRIRGLLETPSASRGW